MLFALLYTLVAYCKTALKSLVDVHVDLGQERKVLVRAVVAAASEQS